MLYLFFFHFPQFSLSPQAFGVLSDKLQSLVDGVRENKEHWLQLAQNVQNKSNLCNTDTSTNESLTLVSSSNNNNLNNNDNNLNNNNNTIVFSRSSSNEDNNTISNGTNSEIPKIVGKLGRLNSQHFFQLNQNGLNCDKFSLRDLAHESMDQ